MGYNKVRDPIVNGPGREPAAQGDDPLLTVRECAKRADVSVQTIYDALNGPGSPLKPAKGAEERLPGEPIYILESTFEEWDRQRDYLKRRGRPRKAQSAA
jgi:hypothetical protein